MHLRYYPRRALSRSHSAHLVLPVSMLVESHPAIAHDSARRLLGRVMGVLLPLLLLVLGIGARRGRGA